MVVCGVRKKERHVSFLWKSMMRIRKSEKSSHVGCAPNAVRCFQTTSKKKTMKKSAKGDAMNASPRAPHAGLPMPLTAV
jgi:hypothetical protein